jgi:CubicO group peptidase (beta-lactamase class C family)
VNLRCVPAFALTLVLVGCAAQPPAEIDLPDAATAAVVDRVAQRLLAETPLAGLSVTIARNGRIVHEAGYGLARRGPDIPAGPAVPFQLHGVSQAMTAVLLLRLAERGVLSLDAPAGDYLPELPVDYASVSLRQLLRHSSGNLDIAPYESGADAARARPATREALLAWLATGRRATVPDESWTYASSGYVAAGLAAEAAARRPYRDLIRDEIAAPLGLASLGWCPDLAGSRAQSYVAAYGAVTSAPSIDFGWLGAAGSLCGTTGNLARWWLAVRSGGLISPGSLAEWTKPLTLERNGVDAEFGHGLGIRLGAWRGHTVVGQVGEGAGGAAVLVEYPDDRLLIVVATNTAGRDVPNALEIETEIASELLALPTAQPAEASIEPEALASVPGLYRSPQGSFCVQAASERLVLATDEEQAVALQHIGAGRFARPGDGDSLEYFLGWPDRTEWFGYAWFGLPMDLATKESETCP